MFVHGFRQNSGVSCVFFPLVSSRLTTLSAVSPGPSSPPASASRHVPGPPPPSRAAAQPPPQHSDLSAPAARQLLPEDPHLKPGPGGAGSTVCLGETTGGRGSGGRGSSRSSDGLDPDDRRVLVPAGECTGPTAPLADASFVVHLEMVNEPIQTC